MSLTISRCVFPIALASLVASASVKAQTSATPDENSPQASTALSPGAGLAIINRSCTSCHESGQILQARPAGDWQPIIERMRANGANISDGDAKILLDYLIKNYTAPH